MRMDPEVADACRRGNRETDPRRAVSDDAVGAVYALLTALPAAPPWLYGAVPQLPVVPEGHKGTQRAKEEVGVSHDCTSSDSGRVERC